MVVAPARLSGFGGRFPAAGLIRQWSLKVPLPDTYAFTEFSERLKWSLVEYVLGLHAQGALEDAGARQQVLAWLNGVQPFLGETLRVPRVV